MILRNTKTLDPSKILIVSICKDRAEQEDQSNFLGRVPFSVPEGCTLEFTSFVRPKKLAQRLNEIQRTSNAMYKIYLTSSIGLVNEVFLHKAITQALFTAGSIKCGMIGLLGSEMPIDGDFTQAQTFYGMYSYKDEDGSIQNYLGKDPVYYKSVHILESGCIITSVDLPFDEKVGEDFIFPAQCLRYRKAGYDIGVYWQEKPWVVFDRDECMYNFKNDSEDYLNQLEYFRKAYKKSIQPLVSILIPTYNKPKYAQEALESALAQTYENTEIIIGDDSTNEEVKEMVKPYLKKYPHIQFYHHGGQLSKKTGVPNHSFVLNKSAGEYIQWLFHDDLLHPEKISKMMNYFIRDLENNIALVTSNRGLIDENSKVQRLMNEWFPRSDTIYNGHYMGRAIMFIIANCIGEMTTCLFRRNAILRFNVRRNRNELDAEGCFCGVCNLIHGDLSTWLNILKSGKDIVFMSEALSAFRRAISSSEQMSNNPTVHTLLPLDQLQFLTIAWLNNVFFKNDEEYFAVCKKWPIIADRWFKPITENDSEVNLHGKNWIIKLKEVIATNDKDKIADIVISFLIEHLPKEENSILPLVRKNPKTGLWEKNNDGVERVYYQENWGEF